MSAVAQRDRRITAGKRMTTLVGEAQQQDDDFWGHDTWQEDSESYHSESDDSAQKDEFDSDFDESETDHEEEELEEGADQERVLELEMKNQKKRSSAYVETARAMHKTKKLKGKKMVTGDGWNAGIVLNLPTAFAPMPPTTTHLATSLVTNTHAALPSVAPSASLPPSALPIVPKSSQQQPPLTDAMAVTRQRRTTASSRHKVRSRTADVVKDENVALSTRKNVAASFPSSSNAPLLKRKTPPPRRFTQEALLVEAANVTEAENLKWLLARKRYQEDLQEFTKEQAAANSRHHPAIVSTYTSRRGQLNLIHFSNMDHVPDILRAPASPHVKPTAPRVCVITGKPAKYQDPKTMFFYYDAAAFQELRRRVDAGELQVVSKTNKDVTPDDELVVAATDKRISVLESSASASTQMNGGAHGRPVAVKAVRPAKIKKERVKKPIISAQPRSQASPNGLAALFTSKTPQPLANDVGASNGSAAASLIVDHSNGMPPASGSIGACLNGASFTSQYDSITSVDRPPLASTSPAAEAAPVSPRPRQTTASLIIAAPNTPVAANRSCASPTRASPRMRKPSAKVLQSFQNGSLELPDSNGHANMSAT
jgi:hypothetical protein